MATPLAMTGVAAIAAGAVGLVVGLWKKIFKGRK